jgi:hypothetical protein
MNNPDQAGLSYMTFHGLRDSELGAVEEFLKPVAKARGERNRAMCARLADISGLPLDYDTDVLPLSRSGEGGSVTERHLVCALSLVAIREYGDAMFDFFKSRLSFSESDTAKLKKSWETSGCDEFFLYRLIGIMKAELVERFYKEAGPLECPPIKELVKFAGAHDIIITYPYLGDVTDSVTGDKKARKFEDGYMDELFETLKDIGVGAVSYMPARNSREQIVRVRELADRYGMLQISGEDINSPSQAFISEASKDPYFANLIETTWKLVAHEKGEIDLC